MFYLRLVFFIFFLHLDCNNKNENKKMLKSKKSNSLKNKKLIIPKKSLNEENINKIELKTNEINDFNEAYIFNKDWLLNSELLECFNTQEECFLNLNEDDIIFDISDFEHCEEILNNQCKIVSNNLNTIKINQNYSYSPIENSNNELGNRNKNNLLFLIITLLSAIILFINFSEKKIVEKEKKLVARTLIDLNTLTIKEMNELPFLSEATKNRQRQFRNKMYHTRKRN